MADNSSSFKSFSILYSIPLRLLTQFTQNFQASCWRRARSASNFLFIVRNWYWSDFILILQMRNSLSSFRVRRKNTSYKNCFLTCRLDYLLVIDGWPWHRTFQLYLLGCRRPGRNLRCNKKWLVLIYWIVTWELDWINPANYTPTNQSFLLHLVHTLTGWWDKI